jgi:hypothetical protein
MRAGYDDCGGWRRDNSDGGSASNDNDAAGEWRRDFAEV